ncbi:PEP-CTERM sorting domain-containing protein [Rhodoferax sp. 4810]|nr:PEP-CTERM sorting domain-containing protein [Rhodoferax jenense]
MATQFSFCLRLSQWMAHSVATLLVTSLPVLADVIPIDPSWPALSPAPLTLPIPFTFDGGGWTDAQKESGRAALSYLGSWFVGQPAFKEEASPSDFSIHWGDAGFFQDWGVHGGWDLNFSGALAIAAKSAIGENAPWDKNKYPLGEIYFNPAYRWHFNPFTAPDEGDPANPTDGEFDFWSILLHETIHMLSVNTHAIHSDEVMFAMFSDGERRWTIQESDRQLLIGAGYDIRATPMPEPGTLALVSMAAVILLARRKRHGS